MRIYRHAESVSNAGGRTETAAGIALSPLGEDQARKIAEQLLTAPDLFVVSPYLRTQQTAAPSMDRYALVPVEVWPIQEFTYLSTSKYNGTTPQERAAPIKEYWERGDAFYRDGTTTESFNEFLSRVDRFIEQVRTRPEKDIVVFGHGHFIRALRMRLTHRGSEVSPARAMREYETKWRALVVKNGECLTLKKSDPRLWK